MRSRRHGLSRKMRWLTFIYGTGGYDDPLVVPQTFWRSDATFDKVFRSDSNGPGPTCPPTSAPAA